MDLPIEHKNLSRMGNLLTQITSTVESISVVSTLHNELISGWIGDLQVFFAVPFHTGSHALLTGTHSGGKSFILELQMKYLIEGTFTELSYASLKSETGSGYTNDMKVEFYPDIPPRILGVTEGGNHTAGGNANSEDEALLKMRLTTGRQPYQSVKILEDGSRVTVTEIGLCNCKYNAAANVDPDELPPAVRSRFYMNEIPQGHERDDAYEAGASEKGPRQDNPALGAATALLINRMHRYQSLVSKIATLISCGVLPPIQMDLVTAIFLNVMKRGKSRGLKGTNHVRHLERD